MSICEGTASLKAPASMLTNLSKPCPTTCPSARLGLGALLDRYVGSQLQEALQIKCGAPCHTLIFFSILSLVAPTDRVHQLSRILAFLDSVWLMSLEHIVFEVGWLLRNWKCRAQVALTGSLFKYFWKIAMVSSDLEICTAQKVRMRRCR